MISVFRMTGTEIALMMMGGEICGILGGVRAARFSKTSLSFLAVLLVFLVRSRSDLLFVILFTMGSGIAFGARIAHFRVFMSKLTSDCSKTLASSLMSMFLWSRYAMGWIGPFLFATANEISGQEHVALIPVALLYSISALMCCKVRSVAVSRATSTHPHSHSAGNADASVNNLELNLL
ncbi:MAG: hypothetical protein MHM6MM_001875 [Cercozoa sp. M6MM]